ncbi:MAG: hypothetical protein ACRCTW_05790 [Lactococcus garvieae]
MKKLILSLALLFTASANASIDQMYGDWAVVDGCRGITADSGADFSISGRFGRSGSFYLAFYKFVNGRYDGSTSQKVEDYRLRIDNQWLKMDGAIDSKGAVYLYPITAQADRYLLNALMKQSGVMVEYNGVSQYISAKGFTAAYNALMKCKAI